MAYPLAEQNTLQKQNISSEPVHSRINELMTLHEFMADANINSGSKTAETIMEMWTEGNMPYIKQYPTGAPIFEGISGEYAAFTDALNFPQEPDTLHIEEGNVKNMIAEMAHAIHYNAPKSVRDSINQAWSEQAEKYGEDVYGFSDEFSNKYFPAGKNKYMSNIFHAYKKGEGQDVPVEFYTHSIAQPELEKRMQKAQDEDWKAENPWVAKIIEYLDNPELWKDPFYGEDIPEKKIDFDSNPRMRKLK